jgi:hypothetical protein
MNNESFTGGVVIGAVSSSVCLERREYVEERMPLWQNDVCIVAVNFALWGKVFRLFNSHILTLELRQICCTEVQLLSIYYSQSAVGQS